jgi:hypothetical protein
VAAVTFGAICTETLQGLGENPTEPVYYSVGDAGQVVNWAQRLFVLLTLCLETSDTLTLAAVTTWYSVRTQVSDWLLPLRLEYAGAKLRPARLSELDALDTAWQASPGDPTRYASLGLDLVALYKQPGAPASLDVMYAKVPARMTGPLDVPEIPEAYHGVLPGAAIALARLREGGQEMTKAQPLLRPFWAAAQEVARYTRQRSLDLRYDRIPPELDRFDLSRLLAIEKKRNPWLQTSDTRKDPESS